MFRNEVGIAGVNRGIELPSHIGFGESLKAVPFPARIWNIGSFRICIFLINSVQ